MKKVIIYTGDLCIHCDWAIELLNRKNIKFIEYNIAKDIPSAQAVFKAFWRSARLAPLDVCNQVYLPRHKYQLVKNLATEPAYSIIGNYLAWLPRVDPDYPTKDGDNIITY